MQLLLVDVEPLAIDAELVSIVDIVAVLEDDCGKQNETDVEEVDFVLVERGLSLISFGFFGHGVDLFGTWISADLLK
jgi:hypothetical protein